MMKKALITSNVTTSEAPQINSWHCNALPLSCMIRIYVSCVTICQIQQKSLLCPILYDLPLWLTLHSHFSLLYRTYSFVVYCFFYVFVFFFLPTLHSAGSTRTENTISYKRLKCIYLYLQFDHYFVHFFDDYVINYSPTLLCTM